jgi:uncharacterized protein (TIGR00255 family)
MTDTLLKSMTGYGQATRALSTGRLNLELQSVNRRHLEMNINLPRHYLRFEQEIRGWLNEKIGRGQINCYVQWKPEGVSETRIKPNLPLAKAVKEAWETIARELNIAPTIDLNLLARQDILHTEEAEVNQEEVLTALKELVLEALSGLDQAKSAEGRKLASDFLSRLEALVGLILQIEQLAPDAPQKHREKLKLRLEEYFSGHVENEEKVLREVALLAEKIDITEEVVRFKSHVQALQDLIQQPLSEPKGKKIEFILQELHREINTIGSKSNAYNISTLVIEVKSELEKMREQVQNIE